MHNRLVQAWNLSSNFFTRFSQVTLGSSKTKWSWQHLTTSILLVLNNFINNRLTNIKTGLDYYNLVLFLIYFSGTTKPLFIIVLWWKIKFHLLKCIRADWPLTMQVKQIKSMLCRPSTQKQETQLSLRDRATRACQLKSGKVLHKCRRLVFEKLWN